LHPYILVLQARGKSGVPQEVAQARSLQASAAGMLVLGRDAHDHHQFQGCDELDPYICMSVQKKKSDGLTS
jgi:hypothetical protein